MSSMALRLLALAAMVCDHASLALFPSAHILRLIGRLSFPLVCLLLAEGARHTRSRLRYALRLTALALACEVPFDLLVFGAPVAPAEQNAVFSLLLSLGAITASEALERRARPVVWALACLLAMALRLSYGWLGPALCLALYHARGRAQRAAAVFILPLAYVLMLMCMGVQAGWVRLSLAAPLAALPVFLYDGRPGARGRWLSAALYAAVPAHLLALLALRAARVIPPWFG